MARPETDFGQKGFAIHKKLDISIINLFLPFELPISISFATVHLFFHRKRKIGRLYGDEQFIA
jgi:hypothetical protein